MSANSTPAQVEILGQQITRIEYRGQQVVTFAMIDEVHGRPKDTANKRFLDNKGRFVEGEDHFVLTASEIRSQSLSSVFPARTPKAYLITKRGYLKIAKTLGDDKAWDVFGEMLDRYFIVEEAMATLGANGQHELDLDSDDGMKAFRSEITRSGSLIARNIDGVKLTLLGYLSKTIASGISHVSDSIADLYQRTGKGLNTINNNVKSVHARLDELNNRLLPANGDTPIILSEWYACARIYRDLYGVEHMPRQGMLSAAVTRSLDSFVLKHRQNHHVRLIDLASKPTKAWHEGSVRLWFDEIGRRMIDNHLKQNSNLLPFERAQA